MAGLGLRLPDHYYAGSQRFWHTRAPGDRSFWHGSQRSGPPSVQAFRPTVKGLLMAHKTPKCTKMILNHWTTKMPFKPCNQHSYADIPMLLLLYSFPEAQIMESKAPSLSKHLDFCALSLLDLEWRITMERWCPMMRRMGGRGGERGFKNKKLLRRVSSTCTMS